MAMRRGWRNGVQGARCRKCVCLRCLADERELWAVGQEWWCGVGAKQLDNRGEVVLTQLTL